MLEVIAEYSQGNPGAMQFLIELFSPFAAQYSVPIAVKLTQIESLRGTNLCVLWSDLCNKDMSKVAKLCINCPNDILEDACSRQDYSGRELVKDYFN